MRNRRETGAKAQEESRKSQQAPGRKESKSVALRLGAKELCAKIPQLCSFDHVKEKCPDGDRRRRLSTEADSFTLPSG